MISVSLEKGPISSNSAVSIFYISSAISVVDFLVAVCITDFFPLNLMDTNQILTLAPVSHKLQFLVYVSHRLK